MTSRATLISDENGGPAAEFALVLPVMLAFLLGIVDVGRYIWEYNLAEKATQMGTRYAVATDMVASGLAGYSFSNSCGVPQGDAISSGQFPGITCVGGGSVSSPTAVCTLNAASSCATAIPTTSNAVALGNIVTRMRNFKSDITPANVTVTYGSSGLGFAGDPNGSDVAPIVTVTVTGLRFQPVTGMLFNRSLVMGNFSYSLTMEDGQGTTSN